MFGFESYEEYVKRTTTGNYTLEPESEEMFNERMAQQEAQIIRCMMRNHMYEEITKEENFQNLDLMMEIYNLLAPVLNLKSKESITEEAVRVQAKYSLKSKMEKRKRLKKNYKENPAEDLKVEIDRLTKEIAEIRSRFED